MQLGAGQLEGVVTIGLVVFTQEAPIELATMKLLPYLQRHSDFHCESFAERGLSLRKT